MKKRFGFKLLEILGVVVLLLLIVMISSPWWFNFNLLRGPIASLTTQFTGREASIANIDLDMGWVPTLTVDGITLGNADWANTDDMVNIKRFQTSVELGPLLRGQVTVPELVVTAPKINLARNAKGDANWVFASEDKASEPAQKRANLPIFRHLQIKAGEFVYKDATRDFNFVARINNFEGNAGGDEPLHANAKGQLQGEPFTLTLSAGSMRALQNEDKPYPVDLNVAIGETRGVFKGSIDRPAALRGLDIDMDIEGPNLKALYPVLGVPLPATPPYRLAGRLQHSGTVWGFENFDGMVGDSDLAGDFKVDTGGERMAIVADLTSRELDFDDLAPIIGAPPDESETASAKQEEKSEEAADSDKAIPDARIDLTKLRTADADVTLKAKHVEAPDLPIDDLNLDLTLENGLLRLSPLQFGVADGNLNAYATIDASVPTISWNYDVRLRDFRLARLLRSASLKDAGNGSLSGDIKLKARGNTLHDTLADSNGRVTLVVSGGQFSNLLLELAGVDLAEALGFAITEDQKVPIRCVVGDLDIDTGVATSRTLVVDTTDTRVDGDLTADLKDETFKLKLTPEPKDPSFFSVRTPVKLSGTFKDIGIAPDYASLGLRAGAAVALGLLATPAASLLAFVEPGLGQDAQCDNLLKSTQTPIPGGPAPRSTKQSDGKQSG